MTGGLSPPTPISSQHQATDFACGRPALDNWLRERALASEGRSARTYVVCLENRVVAYYCFAAGSVSLGSAPKRLRRNMPNDVPVILVGRLAVDASQQGKGLGKSLLKDALARALGASRIVGVRAVMVHAIDEQAAAFYRSFGFVAFPAEALTFFLPMETIRNSIE